MTPDPDLLAHAAMEGQKRYGACLAPRDTTYDPFDAVYDACVAAVQDYLNEEANLCRSATPTSENTDG